MIYMFCADSAFSDVDETLGFMSDKMLNYFYNVTKIIDERSSYLLANNRLTCTPYEKQAYGQMKLYLDDFRSVPEDIDAPTYSTEEQAILKALFGETDSGATEEEIAAAKAAAKEYQKYLFNIIELSFLQKSSGGALLDVDTLNALLMSEGLYKGYVKDSINLSTGTTTAKILLADSTRTESSSYIYQDYIGFTFNISGVEVPFRVFLKGQSFMENYPLSVLTKVVYPCDMTYLIDMPYENVQSAISGSASFSDVIHAQEITDKDHTGSLVYQTKYVCTAKAASYSMPFNIFYKGAVPAASRCRNFIRASIIRDYPKIEQSVWEEILPYLFVDATYYIVPNYACRTLAPEMKIYRDIGNFKLNTFIEKIKELYPNDQYSRYSAVAHLLEIAGSGLVSYVYPSSANTETHQDLSEEIPGYMPVDSTSALFEYMDEHVQKFAKLVAQAIKIAQGDTTIITGGDFTYVTIEGKAYLEFVVNFIEYYMLMKTSF